MSKAQHTPGPWVIWKNGQTIDGPRYEDGSRKIVAVAQGDVKAEQESNARLIAAAPELLEALEKQEEYDEQRHSFDDLECFYDDPETRDEYSSEYHRRRANRSAIAKAKGE